MQHQPVPAAAGRTEGFQACANGLRGIQQCAAGTARCAELYHDVKQLSNLCYDWSSRHFAMLRFLSIKRLAVIDAVEVEFDPGLNVLTGETGAGKSILVEAVGLLLGGRASGDLVRTGEDAAAIEAIFESGGEELLVRREITAQGRSRAFINGTLATAGALKELSNRLIELHGQHEHQTLLDPSTHLEVIDTFGRLDVFLTRTAAAFETLRASQQELARVRAAAGDRESRLDLIAFQLGELDRANLKACSAGEIGEDLELTAVRQVLANAERVER